MRVNAIKSKTTTSYSIIKDVVVNGKRTTKVVKRLGNDVEILRDHPGVNPREWAEEQAAILTREHERKINTITYKAPEDQLMTKGTPRAIKNVGFLYLRALFHQLKIQDICQAISQRHAIKFNLSEVLELLIYARILEPASKRSSLEFAKKLAMTFSLEIQHIYRALDILASESEFIEQQLYRNSTALLPRNTKILYYDCTNFYFEMEQAFGLKQYGKSKEHRPNPIVQMGLFMDGSGIPLAFDIFEGQQNEQPTLKPLERRIIKDFHLSDIIVCTDAGLSSTANKKFNALQRRAFITTHSLKRANADLKAWALSPEGWRVPGSKKVYHLDDIDHSSTNTTIYYKERWEQEAIPQSQREKGLKPFEERIIVTYSPVYANYQANIREGQIDRAIKHIERSGKTGAQKKQPQDPARFIKTTSVTDDGEIANRVVCSLDNEVIQKEAMFDGFYAVSTNLEDPVSEIISINQKRWQIEECFRMMKHEFKARPVYLQKDNRIRAHFLTCFISLVIFRILQAKLDNQFTCTEMINQLQEMNLFHIPTEGYLPGYERTDFTDQLHSLFPFRTDYCITTESAFKKILKTTKKKTIPENSTQK